MHLSGLEGRVAVVTRADRGIGPAALRRLARKSVRVAVVRDHLPGATIDVKRLLYIGPQRAPHTMSVIDFLILLPFGFWQWS
jgi:NAD(P)-dependent dehydrogenase (short-subunit alcohol dehydrogenase family)